jgi:hypothetical protein
MDKNNEFSPQSYESAIDLLNAVNQNVDDNLPAGNAVSVPIAGMSLPAAGNLTLAEKFDPKRLRISQNFGETTVTKKVLTSVPVAKPNGGRTA